MLQLIRGGEDVATCYFADNDHIAAGAFLAFSECGYRIPKDVSIVGFDDLPICEYLDPPLTTVHVPKQYMGEMAASRLIQVIEERSSRPTKIEIDTQLICRKSVI